MGNTEAALSAFRLVLACLPAVVYLAFLGAIQCRSRPYFMTGRRDLAALATTLAPILTVSIDWRTVPDRWPILAAAGVAAVGLLLLFAPRELSSWVFYNADRADVENLLAESLTSLGHTPRTTAAGMDAEGGSVSLSISDSPWFHTVTVYHRIRSDEDAAQIENRLAERTLGAPSASPHAGFPFLAAALALLAVPTTIVVRNYDEFALLLKRAFTNE